MSRHDGVSCDSCLKNNFRGRRYKCLICYDYDLCASCYEEGATSTRHTTEHPMQCILTRSDFDLYYGGEALSLEQPQAYTCPYCNRMGFTDSSLQEHVTTDHTDTSFEVVCPVCAAVPGGDPNLVTEDFVGHLTLEHRTGPRDLISFLDEPSSIRHGGVRRVPHSSRGVGSTRARRSNMHFRNVFSSSGGLSSLSPSSRDAVDPIAELLSQLSGVRRSAASGGTGGGASTTPSQLQQLHMQIQLERQQVTAARQQLERLPRRQTQAVTGGGTASSQSASAAPREVPPATSNVNTTLLSNTLASQNPTSSNPANTQFLLARFMATSLSDAELAQVEQQRADRSLFAQSLALATLAQVDQEPEEETSPIVQNESNESVNNSPPPTDKPSDVRNKETQRDSQSPGKNDLTTKPKGSKPPPPSDRKPKLNPTNNKPRDIKSRGDTPKTRPEPNQQLSDRR